MPHVVRFGVSLEEPLLAQWDTLVKKKGYTNRSEALRDLIRSELVGQEWVEGKEVVGSVTLVYDHHKRELVRKLTSLQHDFGGVILASQHIHIDHHHCLEIIAVKGSPGRIRELSDALRGTKGVKHGALSMSTTAKTL